MMSGRRTWKPSAMSMISQISPRSGTTMDTGRNSALSDSGSSACQQVEHTFRLKPNAKGSNTVHGHQPRNRSHLCGTTVLSYIYYGGDV